MRDMADVSSPLDTLVVQQSDPWALPEPEPTTLIGLWPHAQPPRMTEVRAALRRFIGDDVTVGDEPPAADDSVLWTAVFELPGLPHPVIIWSEPAKPLPPGELDDPQAEACKWVLGAETVLDGNDTLSSYTRLVRAVAGSFQDIPAILDVNCTRWHLRHDINRLFLCDEIEPPAEVLWIIHVVQKPAETGTAWLHTHGLWRCGRPELELLQIPGECIGPTCELLSTIAELSLDEPLPEPGEPLEVGRELAVTLQPWREAAKFLDHDIPGSITSRQADADDPHQGIRAVICESRSPGTRRATRLWPKDIVLKVQRHEAALYRSQRATDRQAALAQGTWSQLIAAFSSVPGKTPPGWSVLIKAGFTDEGLEPTNREHLWFELLRVDGERAEGRLINQPATVPRLNEGDAIWIDAAIVTDWRVCTPIGDFGPDEAAAMSRAIEELKSKAPVSS
ncbi:MAG: DUF4026 domain-containing protein [Planctomycetota bacterium]|nr:DUF4026 domain-containing protein [Planctomycetota bacterium]